MRRSFVRPFRAGLLCSPLIYPPRVFLWVARQTGLVGHFLFSAKFLTMGNFKNRLTATKPQNHFARIFFKVCMRIEQAFESIMMVITLSTDACGRRWPRSKLNV